MLPETPVKPDPKALACLKAAAYSMLLPRRRATYTLLMVSHGGRLGHLSAYGGPCGERVGARGEVEDNVLYDFQYIIGHTS